MKFKKHNRPGYRNSHLALTKAGIDRIKFNAVVGIDEVGRGPLAGPVAVCALRLQANFNSRKYKDFRDSKKLSHKQRVEWLKKIDLEKEKGNLSYRVSLASNEVIDRKGIVFAINHCLKKSLRYLNADKKKSLILLDGGLRAPAEYENQRTIIKGDEKELAIALASIAAKVRRDAYMDRLSLRYPGYGLERHKGYGTAKHCQAIRKLGPSPIHRRSFLRGLIKKAK